MKIKSALLSLLAGSLLISQANAQSSPGLGLQNDHLLNPGVRFSAVPTVANLTALKAVSITGMSAGQTMYRAGYATAGDGGEAMYTLSLSACSIAAGAGDNGAEVDPNAGTGCWILSAPSTGVDLRVWGGMPSTTVDVPLQAAVDWACTSHVPINVALNDLVYNLSTTITIGNGSAVANSTCNNVTIQGTQHAANLAVGQYQAFSWVGAAGATAIDVQGPAANIKLAYLGVNCLGTCATGFRIHNIIDGEFHFLSVAGQTGPAFVLTSEPANVWGGALESARFTNLYASSPGTGGSGAIIGDITCTSSCTFSNINLLFDHLNLTYDGQTSGTYGIKFGMITQSTFVRTYAVRVDALGSSGNSIIIDPPSGALAVPANITFYDLVTDDDWDISGTWAPANNNGITIYGFSTIYSSGPPTSALVRGWTDKGEYFPFSTAWTPTDCSGASLSFTVAAASYYKIGNSCTLQFSITYPATANTNAACIAIPAACKPRASASAFTGGAPSYTNAGFAFTMLLDEASASITMFDAATGAGVQNAGFTGKQMRGTFTFPTQ